MEHLEQVKIFIDEKNELVEADSILDKYGFERIDMSKISEREKQDILFKASLVVGVHNDRFMCCDYMHEGSYFIELFHFGQVNLSKAIDVCNQKKINYDMLVECGNREDLYLKSKKIWIHPTALENVIKNAIITCKR